MVCTYQTSLPSLGLDNFKGETFHSAQWPYNYDPTGKKVAIIGTGASAVQIVPAIAKKVIPEANI